MQGEQQSKEKTKCATKRIELKKNRQKAKTNTNDSNPKTDLKCPKPNLNKTGINKCCCCWSQNKCYFK